MCSYSYCHFLARSSEIIGETDDGLPHCHCFMLADERGEPLMRGGHSQWAKISVRVASVYRVRQKLFPWLRESRFPLAMVGKFTQPIFAIIYRDELVGLNDVALLSNLIHTLVDIVKKFFIAPNVPWQKCYLKGMTLRCLQTGERSGFYSSLFLPYKSQRLHSGSV